MENKNYNSVYIRTMCVRAELHIARIRDTPVRHWSWRDFNIFNRHRFILKKNGFIVCDVRTLHSSQPIVRYWVETVRMHAAAAAAALVASNKWAEQTRKEKKNRRRERNRREKIFLICCFYAKLMKIIICFIGCVRTKHNFSGNACVDGYFKSWFFADAKFLTFTRITLHILIY